MPRRTSDWFWISWFRSRSSQLRTRPSSRTWSPPAEGRAEPPPFLTHPQLSDDRVGSRGLATAGTPCPRCENGGWHASSSDDAGEALPLLTRSGPDDTVPETQESQSS